MTQKKTVKKKNVEEVIEEKLTFLIVENNKLKKLLTKLERVVARIAHHTGTQNMLKPYNIDAYIPGKEDIKKCKE